MSTPPTPSTSPANRRLLLVGIAFAMLGVLALLLRAQSGDESSVTGDERSNGIPYILRFIHDPSSRAALANRRADRCPGAPFQLPSDGLIGLLWADPAAPYSAQKPHPGLDLFGDGEPGTVPVYSVYGGYLTRLDVWRSSVILRHDDPLQPGRTIWTYYTHMASRDGETSFIAPDFPAGTTNVWVPAGTLLGYQGVYSGAAPPIGMHVHVSVVLGDDAGSFRNEAELANTVDPSPYFGLPLIAAELPDRPIACREGRPK